MFKNWFIIVTIIVMLFSASSFADSITLSNGQTIDVSNLSDNEIISLIKINKKTTENKGTVENIIKNVNPNDLDSWRKLITGTIKDACNDLSITVNEFVKTPVGMGVAALIIYKVMGEDLLHNGLRILIIIPLWFILTGIILFLGWYFYSNKTIKQKIYDKESGKLLKINPSRVSRYKWEDRSSNKEALGYALIIIEIISTILAVLIVLI